MKWVKLQPGNRGNSDARRIHRLLAEQPQSVHFYPDGEMIVVNKQVVIEASGGRGSHYNALLTVAELSLRSKGELIPAPELAAELRARNLLTRPGEPKRRRRLNWDADAPGKGLYQFFRTTLVRTQGRSTRIGFLLRPWDGSTSLDQRKCLTLDGPGPTHADAPGLRAPLKDFLKRVFYVESIDKAYAYRIGNANTRIYIPENEFYLTADLHNNTCNFDAYADGRRKGFGGRDYLFDKVSDLVKDPGSRSGYLVIYGEPGIGKSAFLAELINRRPLDVFHFNIAAQGINTLRQFLGNICARLIEKFRLDYDRFPDDFDKDGKFLNRVLAEASSRLTESDHLLIAVDALDEVDYSGRPPAANPLFLPPALPKGIFVVVTSRDRPDLTINAQCLAKETIEPLSTDNLDDVRKHLEECLRRKGIRKWITENRLSDSDFVDLLVERSEGNFMYLRCVLPQIEAGDYRKEGPNELPNGLRSYYIYHWRKMQDLAGNRLAASYERVVCALAAVNEPVTVQDLARWTGIDRHTVVSILREWREFLDRTREREPKYAIYHQSFREFLAEEVDPELANASRLLARSALGNIDLAQ